MTWQRRMRLVVAVFLVVFPVVVYRAIRPREAPGTRAPAVERVDPAASTETAAGVLTLTNGETIRFARALTYPDGRSHLLDVTVTVPRENGRQVTITAREAVQRAVKGTSLGLVDFDGHIVVTTSDGLRVKTEHATYDSGEGIVRAPGPVTFDRGGLTGAGLGATYDRQLGQLWLLDQARVSLAPEKPGDEPLQVTSGAAGLSRPEHLLRFERGVHIERADRVIDALDATVNLTEDDKRVTVVELRGDARVTRPPASPAQAGDVRAMTARDMDLTYAQDGQTLQAAALTGDALVALAGDPASADRRIAADRLDVALAPDGVAVTSLKGQDRVVLTLPATQTTPAQRITAATLDAQGEGTSGLRSARFGGGVEYREAARTSGGRDRVARSARLEAALQPGFGAIDAARFIGNVTFSDAQWRGEGPLARYDPARGELTLLADPSSRTLPQVADDRVTIDGRTIALTLDDRRLTADGAVRSVLRPGRPEADAADAARLPAILAGDQPVYVTAAKLDYDGAAALATYTGGARLWQGDTLVQGDAITLDQRRGNLSASGKVHTVMTFAEAAPAAGPGRAATTRTVADASELEYDDGRRRATYRKSARVNGPDGDLHAARIELDLAESDGKLSRVEAFDEVTAVLEQKYTVTGTHLTYLVEEQRYVIEGTPVRALEKRPTECLETIGTILTFLRSTDTINVEGTEGNRSRTRPVPCTGRRP